MRLIRYIRDWWQWSTCEHLDEDYRGWRVKFKFLRFQSSKLEEQELENEGKRALEEGYKYVEIYKGFSLVKWKIFPKKLFAFTLENTSKGKVRAILQYFSWASHLKEIGLRTSSNGCDNFIRFNQMVVEKNLWFVEKKTIEEWLEDIDESYILD